jgi:hypothetical protein
MNALGPSFLYGGGQRWAKGPIDRSSATNSIFRLYRTMQSFDAKFRFLYRPILFLGLKFRFLCRPIVRFELRFFNRPILFLGLKGTVSRDFLLPVFFMNQFPPSPRVSHKDRFEFFQKFAEIFTIQGAPTVSTTPVAYFATIFPCVVNTGGKFATVVNDTSGKFAARVNDTGGNFPPVSTTPAANLPLVSTTPAAYNGNNIRQLELEGKNVSIG